MTLVAMQARCVAPTIKDTLQLVNNYITFMTEWWSLQMAKYIKKKAWREKTI